MTILLFLISGFSAVCIAITQTAFKPQGDDGRSLNERRSLVQPIVLSDDTLSKRLGALEKEIKRVWGENKLLRDVIQQQDSTLQQLTVEVKKLKDDNIKLGQLCKEAFEHMISTKEDEKRKSFQVHTYPQTNHTTQDSLQKVNNNEGRIVRRYDGFASENPDTRTKNDFRSNGFIKKRHIRQTEMAQVAFYSTVSVPDLTNLGIHHPIVFDLAITNIGGAYHPSTGVFITPVDGVYVFNLGAMSSPLKGEELELVKDGTWIQNIFPDSSNTNTFQTDSLVAVLELNKGNEVWVRTSRGSGEIHGNRFTFFSGWLLFMK